MKHGLLAGVLAVFLSGNAQAQSAWKVDREGEGVTVYTQTVPGYSLRAFKAVTRMNVSMDAVLALISDAESFPNWYADCSENKTLKKVSNKDFYAYFVNDSPFPVMDRDSITHTTVSQDAATKVVTVLMKGEPKFIPERDDRVRVPRMEGSWTLNPVSPTETEVVLEMRTDSGGSVPAFLADRQVTVGPHKTLVNMKKYIQKPKYKNATVDFETATVTFGK
jgi:hypothetical protein